LGARNASVDTIRTTGVPIGGYGVAVHAKTALITSNTAEQPRYWT
jgi:hypothetical protein